jgi:hypothetical protein
LDADGDGHLDIATANRSSNDVSVLLGDGTGGFSSAQHTAVGTGPSALVTLDLDEDGGPDLAVAALEGIDTVLNDGSGGFVHDGRSRGPTAWRRASSTGMVKSTSPGRRMV